MWNTLDLIKYIHKYLRDFNRSNFKDPDDQFCSHGFAQMYGPHSVNAVALGTEYLGPFNMFDKDNEKSPARWFPGRSREQEPQVQSVKVTPGVYHTGTLLGTATARSQTHYQEG